MKKSHLINFGVLIATVLVFFLGIEFSLRVTGLQTVKPNPPLIYQTSADSRISYELIPNHSAKAYRATVTTNRLGFRGPNLDPRKPLIAILGDSIGFGYGVQNDETIAARIAEKLPEYDVLNTAVPGYHIGMQTATYESKVKKLKPEVLMVIFHPNDFETDTGWLDDQGIIRSSTWEPVAVECHPINQGVLKYIPGKCWLDLNSAFYKAFKKLVNLRHAKESLEESRETAEQSEEADTVTREQIAEYKSYFEALVNQIPEETEKVFVIWPDRFWHNYSIPRLVEMVEGYGFTVINLYDLFGNEVPILGWDTVHPNPTAIEQAVPEIVKALPGA